MNLTVGLAWLSLDGARTLLIWHPSDFDSLLAYVSGNAQTSLRPFHFFASLFVSTLPVLIPLLVSCIITCLYQYSHHLPCGEIELIRQRS